MVFGLFKSKKAPIRQRLEKLLSVRRTWFEWSLADDEWKPTLVVEIDWDLDPASPDFYEQALDDVRQAVRAHAAEDPAPLPPLRVIQRMYE